MKCDMRAPSNGGTEYLMIIEAETALERTALAHFTAPHPDGEELRIIFRVTDQSRKHSFAGENTDVVSAFIAWQDRKPYAPPAVAVESGENNGS